MFQELCGDAALKNVVFVTNMWGEIPLDLGKACERELTANHLKPVLDKGAQLVRHSNSIQSAHNIIRLIMKNRPTTLRIQRELVDEGRDIFGAAAAQIINKECIEHVRRYSAELRDEGHTHTHQERINQRQEQAEKEIEGDYYHNGMAVFEVGFLVFLPGSRLAGH